MPCHVRLSPPWGSTCAWWSFWWQVAFSLVPTPLVVLPQPLALVAALPLGEENFSLGCFAQLPHIIQIGTSSLLPYGRCGDCSCCWLLYQTSCWFLLTGILLCFQILYSMTEHSPGAKRLGSPCCGYYLHVGDYLFSFSRREWIWMQALALPLTTTPADSLFLSQSSWKPTTHFLVGDDCRSKHCHSSLTGLQTVSGVLLLVCPHPHYEA